jgi:cysteine desulfurase family protein (TIGR01976 family)
VAFDVEAVRAQFPALGRTVAGKPAVYLDGPGGTQVPQRVIDAMVRFMERGGSNHGGPFVTSRETDAVHRSARFAIADLLGGSPSEIVFGQNMTSLTFAVSRSLARTWEEGDEIVVTRLDHDANVSPWLLAARDRGVTVRWLDFDPDDGCSLDATGLDEILGPRTRLVAVTHASNATGTVVDVARVAAMAQAVGALTYVDAVHHAPHYLIDVDALGIDFLACSAYKFFGPHTGVLWGRRELLESLDAYKVRPAPDDPPEKWETGTQSFESLAGVTAAVEYLASLGAGDHQRDRLTTAFKAIGEHEAALTGRFLDGVDAIDGVRLYGIADQRPRTPTFAISVAGHSAQEVAEQLGKQGIFVWAGHYYAVEVMRRIGVLDLGGLVRIGFVHYTTGSEVDRVLDALSRVAS